MKWILFLFLMYACSLLPAQQFTSAIVPSTQENYPLLLKFGDSLFGAAAATKGIELSKYDSDMKIVRSVKLFTEEVDGPGLPLLRIIDGKLAMLYYKTPGTSNVQFFSSVVDPVTLNVSAHKQLLNVSAKPASLDYYFRYSDNRYRNRIIDKTAGAEGPSYYKTFFFEPSPDGTKFLAMWNSGWEKDRKVFYSVLDKDMNVIRSGEEQLIDLFAFSLSNACIDNSGNVYISYFYFKSQKGHAEVLLNTKTGSSVKEVIIPDGEPYGTFIGINPKEDKLYICGTYITEIHVAGVYIQPLNLGDHQLGVLSQTVFPKDLVEIFDKEGWGKTSGKREGLSFSIIFDLLVLEDGTMNMTGEFRTEKQGSLPNRIFKIAGSILNIRFNKNGPVFSRIPKARVSAGRTIGDSYRIFEYQNKLIIFYDDHAFNVKRDISKAPTRSDEYNNSVLVAATITEDGSVKREIVIDQSKEDFLAITEKMQQLSPVSYYVKLQGIRNLGGLRKDFMWAKVEIK